MGPTGECAECRRQRSLGAQAKLRVNAPGDRYEQEADHVADEVMRMSAGGGDEAIRHTPADGITPFFQRGMQAGDDAADVLPAVADRIESMRGGGRPLDASIRVFMEPRFGHSFAAVRVHADPAAADLAHSVGARAFTVGRDIFFADGEYRPGSSDAHLLLAHELTHTIQQQALTHHVIQRLTFAEFQQSNRATASAIIRTHQAIMNSLVPSFEMAYPLRDASYARAKTAYADRTSELMADFTDQNFNRWHSAANTILSAIHRIVGESVRPASSDPYLQAIAEQSTSHPFTRVGGTPQEEHLRRVWTSIGEDLQRLRNLDINIRGAQIEARRQRRARRAAMEAARRRRTSTFSTQR